MSSGVVTVGLEPSRNEHGDAIALGAVLSRLIGAGLLIVSVYEAGPTPWNHVCASP